MTRLLPLLLLTLGLPFSASAEEWKCKFGGNWQTDGSGESAALTWKLSFATTGQGWKITGHDSDSYGKSQLNGTCGAQSCAFTQTYTSGAANGQSFAWTGSVTDRQIDATRSALDIKGTWKAGDGSSAGSWTATATCAKQGAVANHDGCARGNQMCVCGNTSKAGQCGTGTHKAGLYCQCDRAMTHHDGCAQRAQACQCSNTGRGGKCETGPHKEGLYCRCD